MEQHWLWILTNNQTTAVVVGFIGLLFGLRIGYSVWKKQHDIELADKYFAEYLDAIYRFVAIKKEEVGLRKGKNRRFNKPKNDENYEDDEQIIEISGQLSKLNRQEIQNDGLIKSRNYLLRKLNDNRWQEIDKIKSDFGAKYKNFSKKPVAGKDALKPDVYQEAVSCINESIIETLGKLNKL